MKKNLFFVFVCIVLMLSGCSAPTATPTVTAMATPTATATLVPTPTATSTPTVTSTPTPEPTQTPTSTPTLIPFPTSSEDFIREIKNGCALPPEEIQPINPFPDIPFQSYSEDFRFDLMGEGMLLWLKNEVEKEVGIEVVTVLGMDPYFHSDNDNWYCVGSVLMPKLSEDILWNMRSRFDEDWGKWDYLIILAYWSQGGLVIYEYQPTNTNMPAP